jgi:hypothetical protein
MDEDEEVYIFNICMFPTMNRTLAELEYTLGLDDIPRIHAYSCPKGYSRSRFNPSKSSCPSRILPLYPVQVLEQLEDASGGGAH